MRVKVSEASGRVLDWMVAKCEGFAWGSWWHDDDIHGNEIRKPYNPSADWSQGGPIIERERISPNSDYNGAYPDPWVAESYSGGVQRAGPTPLIAGMRCYVAKELGEEVEVPEDLK